MLVRLDSFTTMRRTWIGWFVTLVFLAHNAGAQNDGRQRIEAAKIAMITNRLNLTTEQASQFWPVYNEYNGKKQELNRRIRQLNQESGPNAPNNQLLNGLREVNATKQKIADLDNEYLDRFLKVITPAQLKELYQTERDFNRRLLERLQQNN